MEMVNASDFVDCNLKVITSPKDTLKVPKKEDDLVRITQATTQTQLEPELLGNLTRTQATTQTQLEPELGNLTRTQATTQTLLALELGNVSCISGEIGNDPNPKRPKAKGRTEVHQCGDCGKFFRYKSTIKRHQKKPCKKFWPEVLNQKKYVG